jgi:hypothetical protein
VDTDYRPSADDRVVVIGAAQGKMRAIKAQKRSGRDVRLLAAIGRVQSLLLLRARIEGVHVDMKDSPKGRAGLQVG